MEFLSEDIPSEQFIFKTDAQNFTNLTIFHWHAFSGCKYTPQTFSDQNWPQKRAGVGINESPEFCPHYSGSWNEFSGSAEWICIFTLNFSTLVSWFRLCCELVVRGWEFFYQIECNSSISASGIFIRGHTQREFDGRLVFCGGVGRMRFHSRLSSKFAQRNQPFNLSHGIGSPLSSWDCVVQFHRVLEVQNVRSRETSCPGHLVGELIDRFKIAFFARACPSIFRKQERLNFREPEIPLCPQGMVGRVRF